MSQEKGTAAELQRRVDAIEGAYEFFLAYAAQGLSTDRGSKSGGELRLRLDEMCDAMESVAEALRARAPTGDAHWRAALAVLEADVAATLPLVRLVASREDISSQTVDNLNANIHLRAVLTDLFLLDELAR
ncbi:MAG: hypothetical protein ACE5GJ_10730 [Gemmatimonadota bacterium]